MLDVSWVETENHEIDERARMKRKYKNTYVHKKQNMYNSLEKWWGKYQPAALFPRI